MPNKEKLTEAEQKEFTRLIKKVTKPSKAEEEELIESLMELIPILAEAGVDLNKKGLFPLEESKLEQMKFISKHCN